MAMMHFEPHPYQEYCVEQIIQKPRLALLLEMGLGKTVITLTAIRRLLGLEVERVLVIAPLRVAQSGWAQECRKWDHLQGLRVARILGSASEREAALKEDADIYVINRENVAWLVGKCERDWKFDMVVIDELSSFKSPQAMRFKALRRVLGQVDRIVGLTGTPAPNSLIDLWAQIYLLDRGERLGRFVGHYRDAYFTARTLPNGVVYKYNLKPGADVQIYRRIQDICISMKSVDYIKLPERVDNHIEIELPADAMEKYRAMERDMLVSMSEEESVSAVSAAVVTNKLLQMANGGLYGDGHEEYVIHSAKLDALEDIIESACGKPVLVYYGYKFDLRRIRERLEGKYKVEEIKGEQSIERWNKGQIEVLLAHPDSAGHGLNLQMGGHIMVWYGQTWSLEKYQQACARLHRQGQTETVIIHHLIAKGTIDEDVVKSLAKKESGQDALLNALKARRDLYI